MEDAHGFLMLVGLIALYFLPTVVAVYRHHRSALAVGVLNAFTGWTFIGWIGSLVWACTYPGERKA